MGPNRDSKSTGAVCSNPTCELCESKLLGKIAGIVLVGSVLGFVPQDGSVGVLSSTACVYFGPKMLAKSVASVWGCASLVLTSGVLLAPERVVLVLRLAVLRLEGLWIESMIVPRFKMGAGVVPSGQGSLPGTWSGQSGSGGERTMDLLIESDITLMSWTSDSSCCLTGSVLVRILVA